MNIRAWNAIVHRFSPSCGTIAAGRGPIFAGVTKVKSARAVGVRRAVPPVRRPHLAGHFPIGRQFIHDTGATGSFGGEYQGRGA